MHEEPVIIKEEIDIDDTKIKLELDEDENDPTMKLSCAGSVMKIIEEQPNMITVPVHDIKSEDELKFIESLGMLEQQQKLFVTSSCENNEDPVESTYACKICHLQCDNHLALASHQINHQLNRNFCSHGCGYWCNGLEEMLEHEYRQHASGNNNWICRICQLDLHNASRLVAHMTSHYVRRFVCALCRRCFHSRQGLQLHRQHSKEICGQLEYVHTHDNDSQLVAVSTLESEFLSQHDIYDLKIKSEPLDEKEEQQLQEVDLLEVNNVVIKTEPKEEVCFNNDSTSIAGKLRGKLRLPSIKKSVKSKTLPATVQMNPTIQFIPVKKSNIPLKPVSKTSPAKRLNILKPKSIQSKNILQSSNTDPNVAANNNSNNNNSNILKMLPNNCMVIKLPANTKIVKIQPNASRINTNSCTIGSKIITLPKAMSISQTPASAPPVAVSTIASAATAPQLNRQQAFINRNAYFSDLSLFESLPESRKIITEFQNQIRSIEQSLPLPGSVLHAKNTNTTRGGTRTIVVPSKMQVIHLPLTKESNIQIRELRYHYPEHRFHWQCPQCARCYEQYLAFCNHLTVTHSIPQTEFENVRVEVKIFKKHLNSLPSSTTVTVASDPEASSAPAAAAAAAQVETPAAPVTEVSATDAIPTVPSPTSSVAGPTKRSKASPKLDSPTKSERGSIKCEICSKCFTTMGAVRIHKMIHTGELPHKCNFCDKRFRTPGQVRVHQRRHTGEKPFKCKVCSLDFTHRETLISHLSRHIGMKRYKCYGCDKSFVVVSGLRAHRRLRPDTCGKVKFTARAHGPRVRVIRGEVVFESHPEHNGYLRSEDPLNILSEINNVNDEAASPPEATS